MSHDRPHSDSATVFATLATQPPPSTLAVLTSTIARRLTPQPIKLRADIELTCYTPAGIDAIKKALRAGEKASSEQVPIKAKLVAPPLYVLSTNATDKVSSWRRVGVTEIHGATDTCGSQYAAVERLERAIESIQATIEDLGGALVVKMKVLLIGLFLIVAN
jgi:translation initiation factor 2 subunit 1